MTTILIITAFTSVTVIIATAIIAGAYERVHKQMTENWLQAQRETIAAQASVNKRIADTIKHATGIDVTDNE